MARDVNRLAEMEVFVEVAERGGLSAAARALGLTPSAVSKLMGRLEQRLAVRLMNRSTRRLQLTEEGARFHERALRILAELEEAEREASEESSPRGRVRVNANVPFGLHCLLPLVPRFLAEYPEVTLDLALSDRVVDLYEERADVAIRVGPLASSALFARKLGESRLLLVASPEYLARAGTPKTPAELARHDCVDFGFARHLEGWPFRVKGRVQRLHVHGKARAGDGETNRRLALSGVGISRLSQFHIGADVRAGRLVPVLENFNPGEVEAVHALYVDQGGHVPARMRVLLDFLVQHVQLGPLPN
jgi:DNA-binding transcriptional LysR family regulator